MNAQARFAIVTSINPAIVPVYDFLLTDYVDVFDTVAEAEAYCVRMNIEHALDTVGYTSDEEFDAQNEADGLDPMDDYE